MTTTTAASRIAATPLIPRDDLFGNPVRSGGQISPDGQWLAWMAPHEGVMNVFMAPFADPAAEKRMTSAKDRPIPQYFWSPDSTALLYVQDKAGDENYLLYKVDLASGAESCLTPFENTRARIVGASETIRDRILVGLNNRDPQWHDVYLLNLTTGALELVLENEGWAGFETDDNLTLRWALRQNEAGGTDLHEITDLERPEDDQERARGEVAEQPRPRRADRKTDTGEQCGKRRRLDAEIAKDADDQDDDHRRHHTFGVGQLAGELQTRADDLAEALLLVAHLDRPAAVVGHHDQHRRLVPRGSVDLHRVEAEGPVAGGHQHAGHAAAAAVAVAAELLDHGTFPEEFAVAIVERLQGGVEVADAQRGGDHLDCGDRGRGGRDGDPRPVRQLVHAGARDA